MTSISSTADRTRQERVLSVALEVFGRYGFRKTSMDEVARSADISRQGLYLYFASKEALFRAAVRQELDTALGEACRCLDEEGAALMEQRGTWLVPTLETFQRGLEIGLTQGQEPVMLEKGKAILEFQQPAFERAIAHHLKIAYGLDDDPKFTTREFQALVKGGLTPLHALQTATINGATLLGIDAGAIEPGKFADIIAIDGDPLQDIGAVDRVVFVMKGGKVIASPPVAK